MNMKIQIKLEQLPLVSPFMKLFKFKEFNFPSSIYWNFD